ncbi:hypothetical protein Sjap_006372 [Stephania japonica]|uniref:Pentatricopeptide repeat-containing protein n=1 Tax=Stephania japonica TaxID=461633 RepID=A0AAP0PKZ9_9MAGN
MFQFHETEVRRAGIINLLGRAGRFAEAQELIKSMPMTPNAAVWGALLGACRIHGNVELGKLLLELEPQNSGRYALLSHIYAKVGRWDDVAMVRTLMKDRNIKTASGRSVINLNGVTRWLTSLDETDQCDAGGGYREA